MKIAIALTDQSFAHTKSMGIFNVSMGLTKGLMHHPEVTELHILGNNECADTFANSPKHVHLHLMDKPVPRRFERVWWDQVGLPLAVRKINPEWLILPKGFPPFLPLFGHTKLACYVHDVIWEYYENLQNCRNSPFPTHEKLYFKALSYKALKSSDVVLTSTQFNANRFLAHIPSTRPAVVGIGFDPIPEPDATRKRGSGILFHVSSFPHKLTELGIKRLQTWLAHRNDSSDIRIHCIGKVPPHIIPNNANWLYHGKVSREELDNLMMQECRACVYFSAYEGYGMPPVESLRCGLPCVSSDIPPIRENIPAQFLFRNDSEWDFIQTLDGAYDATTPISCPNYPSWEDVADNCLQALKQSSTQA